jgi:FKBP-type peptidyl-prolyl cis-trans isomerase
MSTTNEKKRAINDDKDDDVELKKSRSSSSGASGISAPIPKLSPKPTVHDRVVFALRILGVVSSAQAIIKCCQTNPMIAYDDAAKIRKAIKTGLSAGKLQTSASSTSKFWISDEVAPEPELGPQVDIKDVKPGSGDAAVSKGDTVVISYQLALTKNPNQKVESASSFSFNVGGGDVIKGMDAAVLGLKVGGSRIVKIPWQLGYGKRGSGSDVPPESDLTFKITLISIL